MPEPTNRALKRAARAREKARRAELRRYPPPGPTVCEQFSRPISEEEIHRRLAEMEDRRRPPWARR